MKNINLLGCHLLSPFPPSLRLWEPDTAPGIQQCYGTCAWIYPHKHTMAGSWAVTAHFQVGHKQGQKSVISCTTWNSDSQKKFSFLKLWTDTLLWTVMDEETWSTCGHWGQAVWQQVVKFWKICIKNLGYTRNVFTFGYVEVQRLCAVADTAAFALALF